MIAEPPPVASLRLIPKGVSPAEVTVAVAGVWTLPRKKGSRLVKSARRSAGDAMTAVCGCHAPSGDSGVRSVQSRRTHCQISSAPSRTTSSIGQISRGFGLRTRNHKGRSEEHTSELQSLMRISYAVYCLKKKKKKEHQEQTTRLRIEEKR